MLLSTTKLRPISSSSHPPESNRADLLVADQAVSFDHEDPREALDEFADQLSRQEEEFGDEEGEEEEESSADDSTEVEGVDSDLDGEPEHEAEEERREDLGIEEGEV